MIIARIIIAVAALLSSLSLVIYAFLIEPFRIQINEIDIDICDLPESLDGLRICHLSDMHIGKYGRFERILNKALSDIKADLCIISGDMICKLAGFDALDRVLNAIKPRLGIFSVLGNGEHKLKLSSDQFTEKLEKSGVKLLINDHVFLQVNGCEVEIAGVDDPFTRRDDVQRALSDKGNILKILISHSPDAIISIGDIKPDLILAGHTHGGQIRLPFIGALWLHSRYRLPISDGYYDPKTLAKLVGRDLPNVHMYVSRGLSGSGVRARFLCLPEIALINLHSGFHL